VARLAAALDSARTSEERAFIDRLIAERAGSRATGLPLEENRRQCIEVVAEARRYGAGVEGEIEGIQGVEDGVGSDEASDRKTVAASIDFVRATGIDCFAPAIGNAHGVYRETPRLDAQRVTEIVESVPIPIALHGGTGLSDAQFKDLIARGCAKVNISTAIKMTYMQSSLAFLKRAEAEDEWDPPSLFGEVTQQVERLVTGYLAVFGSMGRA
jgi:fructose-bisphosphate aldolase class II